jgi:hypothetical protein
MGELETLAPTPLRTLPRGIELGDDVEGAENGAVEREPEGNAAALPRVFMEV